MSEELVHAVAEASAQISWSHVLECADRDMGRTLLNDHRYLLWHKCREKERGREGGRERRGREGEGGGRGGRGGEGEGKGREVEEGREEGKGEEEGMKGGGGGGRREAEEGRKGGGGEGGRRN